MSLQVFIFLQQYKKLLLNFCKNEERHTLKRKKLFSCTCSSLGNQDAPAEENSEEFSKRREFTVIGIGTAIYFAALLLRLPFWAELSLFLLSYIIIAKDIVWYAVKNTFKGQVFDENFLLVIATGGAFAIKQFPEAVAVMLFFKVGELIQDIALNHSRRSIKSLMEIRADYANLKLDGKTKTVNPDDVNVGDTIIVKPGEKVPLD